MNISAKEIKGLYRDMLLHADMKRPWLLGLLPQSVRTDYYKKGAHDWITVPKMGTTSLGVMPQVNAGVAPVTLSRPEVKFGECKFAHFEAKFNLDVENFERLQRTLDDIKTGKITGTEAIDVLEDFYGKDMTIARIMYNNALALKLYRLVFDGEIDIIDDVHNNAYNYAIDGYSPLTRQLADFIASPINFSMGIIDEQLKRGKVTALLFTDDIASEFIKSAWAQSNIGALRNSGFNYSPVNVFGPTTIEAKAEGATYLTDIGGIPVYRVSCKLDLPNGTTINATGSKKIVAIAERDFGALYTRPTTRFNEDDGGVISDTGDMSYYYDKSKSSPKSKVYVTEGYYVTAITKPNNILVCNLV